MAEWIKRTDLTPDPDKWYWIATGNYKGKTPKCPYRLQNGIWESADGVNAAHGDAEVVAVMEIVPPKPYGMIGNGYGFYFRMRREGSETTYGFGAQSAFWAGRGYRTRERAREAARRLMKLEDSEGFPSEACCILDGYANEVEWLRGGSDEKSGDPVAWNAAKC